MEGGDLKEFESARFEQHIGFQISMVQVEVDDGARLLVEKNLLVASTTCGAQTLTASLAMAQGYHYFESLAALVAKNCQI